MAMRGWESVTKFDRATPSTTTKYRNVRLHVDGATFDSIHEFKVWQALIARAAAGELRDLQRQVRFPLLAPTREYGVSVEVAAYIADFTYRDATDTLRVVDAKGRRTPLFVLKAKWLFLQSGIVIEEV